MKGETAMKKDEEKIYEKEEWEIKGNKLNKIHD